MKVFLMVLTVLAYVLASVAYFYWGWNSISDKGISGICACMAFLIAAYVVVTMFIAFAFENIFNVDLGW